jgi:hypothetical protein
MQREHMPREYYDDEIFIEWLSAHWKWLRSLVFIS